MCVPGEEKFACLASLHVEYCIMQGTKTSKYHEAVRICNNNIPGASWKPVELICFIDSVYVLLVIRNVIWETVENAPGVRRELALVEKIV